MKIVVMDGQGVNPGDMSWQPFEDLATMTVYPHTRAEEVLEKVGDADMVLTNKTVFSAETIKAVPKVKYIGVLATGYNVVDLQAASEQGIVVTNIPAYSTDSVAQMTFAHILNILNRVDYYANLNRQGRWSQSDDFCYWDGVQHELARMTIGIVGLGSIGMKVARIAQDFGMDVFAYTSKNSADLPSGIQKTTMEGLFGVSDIITLHCPLTESTHELINKHTLAKMQPGAILINTGRGPLVNEADVAEALESGQLGAYGADVMCSEPPSADNPLFAQKHAFITPHIAWATVEARERLMHIAVENIKAYLNGSPINVVNEPI